MCREDGEVEGRAKGRERARERESDGGREGKDRGRGRGRERGRERYRRKESESWQRKSLEHVRNWMVVNLEVSMVHRTFEMAHLTALYC